VTTLVCCFDNHKDQFVAAVTTSQRALLSTMKDESIAILHAMEEACARDFVHVQFKSDSQLLKTTKFD
jgi:ribonuclease HI